MLKTNGQEIIISNPSDIPDISLVDEIREPYVNISICIPEKFVGSTIKLCQERRGTQVDIKYFGSDRVQIIYDLPLSEMVFDFYDHLKSSK